MVSDWAAVRDLFDAALALPPTQRQAFVEAAAATAVVRDEVRSLLAHADPDDGWLQPQVRSRIGQRCGSWRLLRLLGSGGMGEVYQAERADGSFQGRAAIKLLKRGLDSAAVLDRFARERSALARLNHTHIARLYDAGLSDDGLPFFVMELVDGEPIDIAARGKTLEHRLQLFLQLADAVAHAHRHLLVHRDLKPGNVLVDREGRVKLLDFGIAKALDPDQQTEASATLAPQRVFTPNYASPEQVLGESATTATDVYSLGVMLYELLTGVRPTGRGATSPAEAARRVLEEQPTRPSTLSPGLVADPQWLTTRRRLQGDLDKVLLKALDKSVDGRYASVDAFAGDIRAYLGGYPISAQAPRPFYLLQRFVRRHRVAVSAAAVVLLAVLGGAGLALWQAQEARQQRSLAQLRFADVRRLANQLVFKYHDQIATLPGAAAAREALLIDAAHFLDGLSQAAADDQALAEELAGTYYRISQLQGVDPSINIGQPARAEATLDKALALTLRYVGRPGLPLPALAEVINMHVSRAELWQQRGRLTQADASLRAGLPLLEQALHRAPNDNHALASAVSLHGVHARILGNQMGHAHLGRWDDACRSADRARAAAEATLAANPTNAFAPDTLAFTLGEQAHCRLLSNRLEEAVALFTQQVGLRDQMAARMPDDIDFRYQRGVSRAQLARAQAHLGRHAAARDQLVTARDLLTAATGADPGNRAGERRLDALALIATEVQLLAGDAAAARESSLQALQRFPARSGAAAVDDRLRAQALILAARAGRAVNAEQALQQARQAADLLQPAPDTSDNVSARWWLALALGEQAAACQALGRSAQARTLAGQALLAWGDGTATSPSPPPLLTPLVDDQRRLAAGR